MRQVLRALPLAVLAAFLGLESASCGGSDALCPEANAVTLPTGHGAILEVYTTPRVCSSSWEVVSACGLPEPQDTLWVHGYATGNCRVIVRYEDQSQFQSDLLVQPCCGRYCVSKSGP